MSEGAHYHVLSGLTGGYLPNSVTCLRHESDSDARRAWLAEVGYQVDCECSEDTYCDGCSTVEAAAELADTEQLPWITLRGGMDAVWLVTVPDSDCEGESDEFTC